MADLQGSFYRERMPPYVVDTLPKKYKPQHAVDVELLIDAVAAENSRLQVCSDTRCISVYMLTRD